MARLTNGRRLLLYRLLLLLYRLLEAAYVLTLLVLADDVIEVAVSRDALLNVGEVAVGARRGERCGHVGGARRT